MIIRQSHMLMAITFSIALSQLVEIQVSLGGPIVSLDELPLLACAGILLISGRIKPIAGLLLVLGFIELGVQAIYPLVHGDLMPMIGEIIKVTIIFAVYGTLVSSASKDPDKAFGLLAKYWVILATISAVIIVLQSIGALPMQAMVQGGIKTFSRPSGLQNDPNFAANSLALSVVFLKMLRLQPLKENLLVGLICLAIFLTESRMGLLLALFILGYWWLLNWRKASVKAIKGRIIGTVGAAALIGVAAFTVVQSDRDIRVLERFSAMTQTLESTTLLSLERTRGLQRESAQERLILAYAGYRVWRDNKLIGVGQDRVLEELRTTADIGKATHNGFIDRLMIGGVFGVAFTIFVIYMLLLSTRLRLQTNGNKTAQAVKVLLPVICLASFFLNVSFWPVLSMLAACLAAQNVSLRLRQQRPSAQFV